MLFLKSKKEGFLINTAIHKLLIHLSHLQQATNSKLGEEIFSHTEIPLSLRSHRLQVSLVYPQLWLSCGTQATFWALLTTALSCPSLAPQGDDTQNTPFLLRLCLWHGKTSAYWRALHNETGQETFKCWSFHSIMRNFHLSTSDTLTNLSWFHVIFLVCLL